MSFDPHKVCMACKHLIYHQGEADYSEVTPGESPEFMCDKKHWSYDCNEYNTPNKLYQYMDKAKTCKDFEIREYEQ